MTTNNSCTYYLSNDFEPIIQKINNNFSILSINVRSLRGKISELLTYVNSFRSNFLFICLTEVCLDESTNAGFSIPNYKSFNCFRNCFGGGIIVYVREGVKAEIVREKTGLFQTHESIVLECQIPGLGDLHLFTLYRPPNCSVAQFLCYLEDNLAFFNSKKLCITGDFNINLLNSEDNNVIKFCEIMESFDLLCTIDKATYFSNIKEEPEPTSCLDHFWHNFKKSSESFIMLPPFSDHSAIILCIFVKLPQLFKTITFRDFSCSNKENFLANLERECDSHQIFSYDINFETCRFIEWFESLTNKYFPLKKKTISLKRACCPWITSRIKKCIEKKFRWFKLFKAKLITYNSFKSYCDKLKYLLKCAESNYYEKRFNKLKNNSKHNWNLLKDLLNTNSPSSCDRLKIDTVVHTNPTHISELFADYFSNIPLDLAQNIPDTNLDGLKHIIRQDRSFYFFESTPNEICSIITKLKSSSDSRMLSKVLKLGNEHFSVLISKLFNLSMYCWWQIS